jgi:predicted RecB family endonuclease
MNHWEVIKASGKREELNRAKIRSSIINAGMRPSEADKIIDSALTSLSSPVTTKKLYRAVKKYLKHLDPQTTIRYAIKKAIYDLGPTGFPFEQYVGKILEQKGYDVKVGVLVKGHCVTHEVDVVATKGKHCYMVECKFHHNSKTHSNIKTALYVHARFLDIKRAYAESDMRKMGLIPKGMLVTNTRFSTEAMKYAECVGLRAVGWKHPVGESLEMMVEEGKTYPVTILPSVNRRNVGALLKNDIVTVKDLEKITAVNLAHVTGMSVKESLRIIKQAYSVCQ